MKIEATAAAATVGPVIWSLLGYQFEAAAMLAGLLSCLTVRVYMGATARTRQGVVVDAAITILALLFTAGAIASQRPTPFFALLTGTGLGALGAGIIKMAVRYVRHLDAFAEAEPDVTDEEGIRRATAQLDHVKGVGE